MFKYYLGRLLRSTAVLVDVLQTSRRVLFFMFILFTQLNVIIYFETNSSIVRSCFVIFWLQRWRWKVSEKNQRVRELQHSTTANVIAKQIDVGKQFEFPYYSNKTLNHDKMVYTIYKQRRIQTLHRFISILSWGQISQKINFKTIILKWHSVRISTIEYLSTYYIGGYS